MSWHIGSTPPAAIAAFFNRSSATNRSLGLASGSSRMARNCAKWPGRSRWEVSWKASNASSVSACASTCSTVLPSHTLLRTPAMSRRRHGVSRSPTGNIGL